jgi:hypothetical protein
LQISLKKSDESDLDEYVQSKSWSFKLR